MDLILDFHKDLTSWLESEISDLHGALKWCDVDISRAVFNYLWYIHLNDRDDYIRCHENHSNVNFYAKTHIVVPDDELAHNELVESDLCRHPWKDTLSKEAGKILVYADCERRLKYLIPIILGLDNPVVVLTNNREVPDEILEKPYIKVLPLSLLRTSAITTSGLYKISPLLTSYIHTIFCFISWLRPTKIICCDGCQTQYQIAAIVGKHYNIPSECYQYGWPGFIHAGFSNLPYTSFISWGEIYSQIMSSKNPDVNFISKKRLGYIDDFGPHDCISFFLQAPVFVSSRKYLKEFYEAIIQVSKLYRDKTIIVRPHPEAGMSAEARKVFKKQPNIEVNDRDCVEDIYRRTKIAVSQYSSCLVESELFGCKSICFNQLQEFVYEALPQNQRVYSKSGLIQLISDFARNEF